MRRSTPTSRGAFQQPSTCERPLPQFAHRQPWARPLTDHHPSAARQACTMTAQATSAAAGMRGCRVGRLVRRRAAPLKRSGHQRDGPGGEQAGARAGPRRRTPRELGSRGTVDGEGRPHERPHPSSGPDGDERQPRLGHDVGNRSAVGEGGGSRASSKAVRRRGAHGAAPALGLRGRGGCRAHAPWRSSSASPGCPPSPALRPRRPSAAS